MTPKTPAHLPSRITTKNGVLYWDGTMLDVEQADALADAYDYLYAERLVAALEANPNLFAL